MWAKIGGSRSSRLIAVNNRTFRYRTDEDERTSIQPAHTAEQRREGVNITMNTKIYNKFVKFVESFVILAQS